MIQIRSASLEDFPFLEAMLVEAFFWDDTTPRPALGELQAHPEFAKLLAGWGRVGDVALVAEDGGLAVGAAWFRVWSQDVHSYGFLDERTPELGIAVAPGHRAQGIGRALLRALVEHATRTPFPGISLSVNPANPALRLYESEGFIRVGQVGGSWTMLKRLR